MTFPTWIMHTPQYTAQVLLGHVHRARSQGTFTGLTLCGTERERQGHIGHSGENSDLHTDVSLL